MQTAVLPARVLGSLGGCRSAGRVVVFLRNQAEVRVKLHCPLAQCFHSRLVVFRQGKRPAPAVDDDTDESALDLGTSRVLPAPAPTSESRSG